VGWELYDQAADPTEANDLAGKHPEQVAAMRQRHAAWAKRVGAKPREAIVQASQASSKEYFLCGE
jgi:hypothetical protein